MRVRTLMIFVTVGGLTVTGLGCGPAQEETPNQGTNNATQNGESNNASNNTTSTNNTSNNDMSTNNTSNTGTANQSTNGEECPTDIACETPGATCEGDLLLVCGEDSNGCLVETRVDCSDQSRVCDDSGESASCVAPCDDDSVCDGRQDGDEFCDRGDVVTCTEAAGCLTAERMECGASRACDDATQTCEPLGDSVATVLIEDVSSGDDACGENIFDPGSDLMFVELQTPLGDHLAWGRTASDGILLDNNDFVNVDVLDGMEPTLSDADECVPDFDQDTVVSLGCGGWLAVEFVDPDGALVEVTDGDVIRVGEYGAQCATGSIADEYDVLGCESGAPTGPGECARALGGGSGEVFLDFTL